MRGGDILFLLGSVLSLIGPLLFAAGIMGPVSITLFLGGMLLAGLCVFLQREGIKKSLKSRNTRFGLGQAVLLVIVLITLAFLMLLSSSHRKRFDFTQTGRYTLDQTTLNVLANLKDQIIIVSCSGMGDMMWRLSNEKLIEQFSFASDRVKHEFVDPTKEPEKVILFSKELTEESLPAIFVQRGKRYERAKDAKESNITNAIIKVTRNNTKVVYFLKGHGERDIQSARDAYALGYIKEKLQEKGFKVNEIEMQPQTGIPPDCAILIVAGPRSDLHAFETQALEDYINAGGRTLIMLEPESAPGFVSWLKSFGLLVGDDIVCETVLRRFMAGGIARGEVSTSIRLTITPKMYLTYNDITRDFQLTSEYVGCRSVSVASTLPEGIRGMKILESKGYYKEAKRQGSWAEADIAGVKANEAQFDEGEDLPGPVPIAAMVSIEVESDQSALPPGHQKKEGKILVFGDADFPTNSSRGYGGAELFLNSVSYLCGEEDLVNVSHKSTKYTDLDLSSTQRRVIVTVAVIIWPLLVIVPGILNWLKRRTA